MSQIGQVFGSTRAVNESDTTLRSSSEGPGSPASGVSGLGGCWGGEDDERSSCCLGPDGTAHWGVFCFGRTVHHAGS